MLVLGPHSRPLSQKPGMVCVSARAPGGSDVCWAFRATGGWCRSLSLCVAVWNKKDSHSPSLFVITPFSDSSHLGTEFISSVLEYLLPLRLALANRMWQKWQVLFPNLSLCFSPSLSPFLSPLSISHIPATTMTQAWADQPENENPHGRELGRSDRGCPRSSISQSPANLLGDQDAHASLEDPQSQPLGLWAKTPGNCFKPPGLCVFVVVVVIQGHHGTSGRGGRSINLQFSMFSPSSRVSHPHITDGRWESKVPLIFCVYVYFFFWAPVPSGGGKLVI